MHSFPIARRVWRFAHKAAANWRDRHRHPLNLALHTLGIPLAFAGLVLFAVVTWPWALAAFVGGYALQFVGHAIEGNDVGELIPVKRLLGLPVVAVVPAPKPPEL